MPKTSAGIDIPQAQLDAPIWGQSGRETAKMIDGKIVPQGDAAAHPGTDLPPGVSPIPGVSSTKDASPAAPAPAPPAAPANPAPPAPLGATASIVPPVSGDASAVPTASGGQDGVAATMPSALSALYARTMKGTPAPNQATTQAFTSDAGFTPRLLY